VAGTGFDPHCFLRRGYPGEWPPENDHPAFYVAIAYFKYDAFINISRLSRGCRRDHTVLLKVLLMPSLLFWAIRHVSIRREVQPLIGYGTTLMLGGFLIGVAFLISSKLDLPVKETSHLLVPTALSVIMIGFLLMVSRFKAITQVVGYLVMENGIFLFALLLLDKTPLLVEMGILLDIFVGALVMGIVINHINQEFGSASTINLINLRE